MKIQVKDWKKQGIFNGVGKLTFEAEDAEQAKMLKAISAPFSPMPLAEDDVTYWEDLAKAIREKFNNQQSK